MKAPDIIHLQWHGDAPTTYTDDDDKEVAIPEEEMDVDLDSVTWCADRVYDADIPYRRDDQVCLWIVDRNPSPAIMVVGCAGCVQKYQLDGDFCPYCGNRIRVEEA